jgi:hypothetical protein
MVEVEWRLPIIRFRVYFIYSSIGNCWIDNLRSDGALRWKAKDCRLGMSGSVMWQAGTSKVVAPRLCQLRTDGLAPANKYWMYWSHAGDICPVNLIVCRQQMLDLVHCFNGCVGRETEAGPVGHSAELRGGVGRTFSREQCIRSTLLMTHKSLLYVDYVRYVWSRVIRGPSVKYVWRVDQVSHAGCTSIQITVTLRYE